MIGVVQHCVYNYKQTTNWNWIWTSREGWLAPAGLSRL